MSGKKRKQRLPGEKIVSKLLRARLDGKGVLEPAMEKVSKILEDNYAVLRRVQGEGKRPQKPMERKTKERKGSTDQNTRKSEKEDAENIWNAELGRGRTAQSPAKRKCFKKNRGGGRTDLEKKWARDQRKSPHGRLKRKPGPL